MTRITSTGIVAILIGSLVSGCATIQQFSTALPEKSLHQQLLDNELPRPDSYDLSAPRPEMVEANAYVVDAPDLQNYMETIIDALLQTVPEPRPAPAVYITTQRGVTAAAPSPAEIYMTRDMLDYLESEDEVAFILAHELSHILLGHFNRPEIAEERRQRLLAAAKISVLAINLANVKVQEMGDGVNVYMAQSEGADRKIAMALNSAFIVQELSETLLNPSWSRAQERAADRLAWDLIVAAGYSPLTIPEMLENLRRGDEEHYAATRALLESLPSELLASGLIALQQEDESAFENSLWNAGMAVVMQAVMDFRNRSRGHYHAAPKPRADAMADYGFHFHTDDALFMREPRVESYREILARPKLVAALEAHDSATKAVEAVGQRDIAGAAAMLASALARDDDAPYVLKAQFTVESARGNLDVAERALDRAARADLATPQIFVALAQFRAAKGEREAAMQSLDRAVEKFHSENKFFAPRIELQLTFGEFDAARETLARCQAAAPPSIRNGCSTVSQPLFAEAEADDGGLFGLEKLFAPSPDPR